MSQTATTSASLCLRKASSTWSPRLPRPMKPSRTRSLAPSTRKDESAAVAPTAASVRVNSRRVIGLAAMEFGIAFDLTYGRTTKLLHAGKDDLIGLLHGGLVILPEQLVGLRVVFQGVGAAGIVNVLTSMTTLVVPFSRQAAARETLIGSG